MSNFSASLHAKLLQYQAPKAAKVLLGATKTLLLVGISGAGKDAIKQGLLKKYPHLYHHIISHTTRAPRRNLGVIEQDGIAYHFIDLATAETMVDNQAFVEANEYSGNLYGTSMAEFQLAHDEGKIGVTDLEVQGVDQYMALSSNVRPLFILPPSYEVWQQRTRQRYGVDFSSHTEDITRRFATAADELEFALAHPYFYFVVNDDLDATVTAAHRLAVQDDAPWHDEKTLAVAHRLLQKIKEQQ